MDVAYKRNQFRFAHVHLHLSLVNLTEVHHLVDEAEDSLGITFDCLIYSLSLWVVIVLYERQQWGYDECHRCTDLMTDIHEEPQFGVAHLLGVDMFLQTQTVLFSPASGDKNLPYRESDGHKI